MNLSPLPIQKFFDNNGRPLAGGQLFTYAAGTDNKIATYVDASGVTQNENPIRLDFRGECRLWIDPTLAYKFVLAPRNDTDPPTDPIWSVDNITAAPADTDNTAVDTGSVNNISLSIPNISSPVAFTRVIFKAAHTNTGATTLQINGGTALPVILQQVNVLTGGEITEDGIYQAIFDGGSWQLQSQLKFPRTAAETAAGVTPTDYAKPPGEVLRQGNNTTPGTSNVVTYIQAAIDAASDIDAEVYLRDDNAVAAPILIRSTTQQNVAIVGNGRVSTILRPTASDISAPPIGINALIINQNNNGHLHLTGFRFLSATSPGYTGQGIYALEGGGTDNSAQALFSAVIDDIWVAPQSTNTGFFYGGASNLRVSACVFESVKEACFILEGVGNADHQYIGNVLNASFDSFIKQTDDGQGIYDISVIGLHVYQHMRGRVFDLTESYGITIQDVLCRYDLGNFGDCALGRFQDSTGLKIIGCQSTVQAGTALGAFGMQFQNSNQAKVIGCEFNADIGLQTLGGGVLDLEFIGVDFTDCRYGWQHLNGAPSGLIIFRGCRFSNALEYGVLFSAASACRIEFHQCEFINAGVGGIATSRNIAINTSGAIRLYGCRIGQESGSAAAAYYLLINTSTDVKLFDTEWVGSPPIGILDPASTAVDIQFVTERASDPAGNKTFQLTATATRVVPDVDVQVGCLIDLMPTNAAGATLMSSPKSLYVSARVSGVSFTVATADGTAAAGNENFSYRIQP